MTIFADDFPNPSPVNPFAADGPASAVRGPITVILVVALLICVAAVALWRIARSSEAGVVAAVSGGVSALGLILLLA